MICLTVCLYFFFKDKFQTLDDYEITSCGGKKVGGIKHIIHVDFPTFAN